MRLTKLQILNMMKPIDRKTGWTISASGKMTLKSGKKSSVRFISLGDFMTKQGISEDHAIQIYKDVSGLGDLKRRYKYVLDEKGRLSINGTFGKEKVVVFTNLSSLERNKKYLTTARYNKYLSKRSN